MSLGPASLTGHSSPARPRTRRCVRRGAARRRRRSPAVLLAEAGMFTDGQLVFKGGTRLRKCRPGNDGRFSTDLDFAAPNEDTVLQVCGVIDGARSPGGVLAAGWRTEQCSSRAPAPHHATGCDARSRPRRAYFVTVLGAEQIAGPLDRKPLQATLSRLRVTERNRSTLSRCDLRRIRQSSTGCSTPRSGT